MKETSTPTKPEETAGARPGFLKRIFEKIDSAMKAKAEEKGKQDCCCSNDDKGGKCC